jgi:protein TonB
MPDPPRKPESSRAFETHADDSKPTGFRRYINIIAIVVPLVVGLVLILIIVHALNEPASSTSPTASNEPSPAPTTPLPTPTANATPPATTPTPAPIATQPAPAKTSASTPAIATIPKPTSPPATPPPATPAPTADPIAELSPDAANALEISGDKPQVPPLANLAHAHGMVVLDAIISKTGTVQEVHVLSGPNLLQDAALAAAKTNRYKPYLVNGRPVRVHTQISYNFIPSSQPK